VSTARRFFFRTTSSRGRPAGPRTQHLGYERAPSGTSGDDGITKASEHNDESPSVRARATEAA